MLKELLKYWDEYKKTCEPDIEIYHPEDPLRSTYNYSLEGFMWWLQSKEEQQ